MNTPQNRAGLPKPFWMSLWADFWRVCVFPHKDFVFFGENTGAVFHLARSFCKGQRYLELAESTRNGVRFLKQAAMLPIHGEACCEKV